MYRGHAATVHLMLHFGPHLLTLATDGVLKVWDIKTGAEYLEMTFNNEKTEVSSLCHPSTYIEGLTKSSLSSSSPGPASLGPSLPRPVRDSPLLVQQLQDLRGAVETYMLPTPEPPGAPLAARPHRGHHVPAGLRHRPVRAARASRPVQLQRHGDAAAGGLLHGKHTQEALRGRADAGALY